jgi:hypothetical protein
MYLKYLYTQSILYSLFLYASVEEHRSIVDIASGIITLVIDQIGWEQADMKLEDNAVARLYKLTTYTS